MRMVLVACRALIGCLMTLGAARAHQLSSIDELVSAMAGRGLSDEDLGIRLINCPPMDDASIPSERFSPFQNSEQWLLNGLQERGQVHFPTKGTTKGDVRS